MVYPINKETLKAIKRSRLTSLTIRFKQELEQEIYKVRTIKDYELIDTMIKEINKKMK